MIDDNICELIANKVVVVVRGTIPEAFESIKTAMLELFGEWYTAVAEATAAAATAVVVIAGGRGGRSFQNCDFSNKKPRDFDRVKDPIVAMRWIFDVEGCFFICSFPEDWKVRCTLKLLQLGAKDWWNLVTGSYTPEQRVIVTWDHFPKMFA